MERIKGRIIYLKISHYFVTMLGIVQRVRGAREEHIAARNSENPHKLAELATSTNWKTRKIVASKLSAFPKTIDSLLRDPVLDVAIAAKNNPNHTDKEAAAEVRKTEMAFVNFLMEVARSH